MEHKLMLTIREGMGKQVAGLSLIEQADGHQQHIAIDHDGSSLGQLHEKVGGLESLAQVGSHRHTALHHVWKEVGIATTAIHAKRQGAASYADGHRLIIIVCL